MLALPSDHGQFGRFCACCGRNHRFDGALSCRRSSFPLGLGMIRARIGNMSARAEDRVTVVGSKRPAGTPRLNIRLESGYHMR
jgi:hypothetical protein